MIKNKQTLLFFLSVVTLLCSIVFAYFVNHQEKTANLELAKTNRDLKFSKKANADLISEKQPDITAAKNAFNQLFQIDWNLPDQAALDKRASLMAPLVTEEVKKKSLDFKPDPDKTLEQSGASASVDHVVSIPTSQQGDTVTAKAMVFVAASRDGGEPGQVCYAYNLAYDVAKNKITLLDRIGTFKMNSDSSLL